MHNSKAKSNNIKITIVGSGIIGKFNALELSQYGFRITIVDQNEYKNSSNAALGILMGKIYQKRYGRSWNLRKKSLELWPKWLSILQQYNPSLIFEKPLFQLTTDDEKFKKLINFAKNCPEDGLEIVDHKSNKLKKIIGIFGGNRFKGLISHQDGRIDPKILLKTIDCYLKEKNIQTINDQIVDIKKLNNNWISKLSTGANLTSEIIILCNSLDSLKLINHSRFEVKLQPVLGQAIEIFYENNNIDFLSLPKHFCINGKNLIPITKNKIIIGSTDEYDLRPKESYMNDLVDFIDKKPSWLNKNQISRKWFGIRSKPLGEGSPLLRSLEKGLILCSGFYKNGYLLAPACSNWVAEEIKNHI